MNDTIVTIGKFDGMHKGHKELISTIEKNNTDGLTSVLVTFEQDSNKEYIYTEEEKKEVVSELGLDAMVVYPFNEEFMNISAHDFIEKILVGSLGAKKIVVGSDFRFGKNRQGDIELLAKLSNKYGYELLVCEKISDSEGIEISSTNIREYIKNSEMQKVSEALGRDYSVSGTIVKGRQIGRTIGFPTINIYPEKNKIMPLNGVYKTEVEFEDECGNESTLDKINVVKHKGLTNIGKRPTIDSEQVVNVETYIYDFNEDVYGKIVRVYVKNFIRKEQKFHSIDELKLAIENDKEIVLNID